jgi:threonine synthase
MFPIETPYESISGDISCTNCHNPYPEKGLPHICPVCGGLFDFAAWPALDLSRVDLRAPGMWRYKDSFGLPEGAPLVTLGEGCTPLIWRNAFGRKVAFKLEFLNPTGSFKDRGTALIVSFLRSRGVDRAVEDSSGNAGASFAAYAISAGIQASVYVPEYASGPKRTQIEAYGAQVVTIPGSRSKATEAVLHAVEKGEIYASHAFLPFTLPGFATVAYELFQEMGKAPGTLMAPAGQGGLLLGIGRGFIAMQSAGLIERTPKLVGVQALACAPLWAEFHNGAKGLSQVMEGDTLAEGVRIKNPIRSDAILRMFSRTGGLITAVEETQILPGRDALARLGFYVEPTSAIVWNALEQLIEDLPDPVAVVLTGSGLKFA